MKRLLVIGLVLFTLAGPMLGKASADWDWYSPAAQSDDSGIYNYFGW